MIRRYKYNGKELNDELGLNCYDYGSRTYLLDGSGRYTVSAIYYDEKGNIVQTRASNYLGGFDITYNDLDFRGKPNKTLQEHNISGQEVISELYQYNYDYAERLIMTTYKMNSLEEVILSRDSYDELGRLKKKRRHGINEEEYEYNIRNQLTRIKSGEFEEELYYTDRDNLPTGISFTPQFNGNIAAVKWKYNDKWNGYSYKYDKLNRYITGTSFSSDSKDNHKYSECFQYDKHGNIIYIDRATPNAFRTDYIYNIKYDGNQITKITDEGINQNLYHLKEYQDLADEDIEMEYDKNGNLIKDLDRDIVTIRYNLLNLPDTIQFAHGHQIINHYNATGEKLQTEYYTPLTSTANPIELTGGEIINDIKGDYNYNYLSTKYVGNYEYKSVEIMPHVYEFILDKAYNTEGYVSFNHIAPRHYYYAKDHQGNIREVWSPAVEAPGSISAVIQRTQYYPSGLPWVEALNPEVQQKKFNSKEWIETHGYDSYDYHARTYYPAIMRFTTIDPLAEKYPSISPYAYCVNNPVRFIDPDGKMPLFLVPLIKGSVGAIVDATAQVTVSMINGQSFGQAMSSIDYTSVGASFVTSAIAMPGMSTATKAATVAVVAADAAIDVNAKGEIQTIGGVIGENKSTTNAAIDAVSLVVPGKVVNNVTSGFNKAISSDLGSSAAATLTKETKSSLKQLQATINSTTVQTQANAVASYIGGVVGGQANKEIGTGSKTRVLTSLKDPMVQPNDATRVQKTIFPIYP